MCVKIALYCSWFQIKTLLTRGLRPPGWGLGVPLCSFMAGQRRRSPTPRSPPLRSLLLTVCLFWVSLTSFDCLFILSVRVLLQIFPNGCCLQCHSVKMSLGKINEWGLFLVNLLIHRIILGRLDLEMAGLFWSIVL